MSNDDYSNDFKESANEKYDILESKEEEKKEK
jgi:hypothetical protein